MAFPSAPLASTKKAAAIGDHGVVTSDAINTTGANLLIVGTVGDVNVSVPLITDSKSNSWTALNTAQGGTSPKVLLYYSVPTSVGAGHTFTATRTASFPSIVVEAWPNGAIAPFDQQNTGATSASTTQQPGSVTPGFSNELVVTIVGGSDDSSSINSAFTIDQQQPFVISAAYGISIAYLVQTAATAVNPTWTMTASSDHAAAIATFKAAFNSGGMFAVM